MVFMSCVYVKKAKGRGEHRIQVSLRNLAGVTAHQRDLLAAAKMTQIVARSLFVISVE